MKKVLLALIISTFTLFSAFDVQAAEESVTETEETLPVLYGKVSNANVKLPSKNYTGIVKGSDGKFYLYSKGKFASTYNDLFHDATYGWWKIANGIVDMGYTGLYTSPTYGSWYIVNGRVDLSKGQQSANTTTDTNTNANVTATANDGFSDNTYAVCNKVTVTSDAEMRNAIISAVNQHSFRLEATTSGGYSGAQAMNVLSAFYQGVEFEAPSYDIACLSTYFASYSGNYCNVTFEYWESYEQEKYMDQLAAQMKAETAGMSDADKVLHVHEYICKASQYDYSYSRYSPYDCLVNGTSVCQGYAMAFMKLAEACGLKVVYLASDDHAYNAVLLNGSWYFVDVTWDDGTKSKKYYLRGLNGLYSVNYPYASWFSSGRYSINLSATDY